MRFKLFLMIAILAISLTACKKNSSETKTTEKEIKIGIAKLIAHPALDQSEQGVIDELTAQGYPKISFDLQNANGDVATNSEIANKFKNKNLDAIVTISTTTSLAVLSQINDTPIVFVAVTDPVSSGLRTTLSPEKTNITGISDMPPIEDQIKMLRQVLPDVKVIGNIYSPGEANSVTQMHMIQEVADKMGIELLLAPVNNTAEVKQAANILVPKVDAIFVSKDNFVMAALNSVTMTANEYKVPVFSADPSSAKGVDVMLAYGFDYYKSGRSAGKLVARILAGEKPGDLPVLPPDEPVVYINHDVAKRLGITIPESILALEAK